MLITKIVAALALTLALVAWASDAAHSKDDDKPAAKQPAQGIAALDWLAGAWTSSGAEAFEAVYSTPRGGEIVSATKVLVKDRCVFFDFERFYTREGKVRMTPFPGGKQSVEFTLGEFDAAKKRARFSNPAHDFPKHLTYERTSASALRITLEGEEGGKAKRMVLELQRAPAKSR